MRFIVSPLLDGIAAAFEAGGIPSIVRIDLRVLLCLPLLLRIGLILAGTVAARHGADHRTDTGTFTGVAGDGADCRTAERTTRRTSHALATRLTGGLLRRLRRDLRRVNPGRLHGPRVALALIALLLLCALPLGGIDHRRRNHGKRAGQTEQQCPAPLFQCNRHIAPFSISLRTVFPRPFYCLVMAGMLRPHR